MAARKATDDEIKAALDGRTVAEAAQILGMHERNVYTHKARLARQGWSPEHDMVKTVPDGFHLKGTSTLYGKDGEQKLQWVKSNIDHERLAELMKEAVKALENEAFAAVPTGFVRFEKITVDDCRAAAPLLAERFDGVRPPALRVPAEAREAALAGLIHPTKKPDWDNFAKAVDALNMIVWVDDAQIVDGRVKKIYHEAPAFVARVRELGSVFE